MQKKIFKSCVITLVIVLVLIVVAVFTLPMIIKMIEQNEKNEQMNNAEIIGDYILDGVANDTLLVETTYHLNSDLSYVDAYNPLPAETDEIKEIVDSKKFVDAYTLSENAVLISEGATFQQVTGYIVTNGNEEIGKYVDVPEEFMYDNNKVTVIKEKDNLYSFYGGL